jgi:hypothetical protein
MTSGPCIVILSEVQRSRPRAALALAVAQGWHATNTDRFRASEECNELALSMSKGMSREILLVRNEISRLTTRVPRFTRITRSSLEI